MIFGKYICKIFGHKEYLDDHFFPETVCERCRQTFKPKPVSKLGMWEMYFLSILVSRHRPFIIHLAHQQRISRYERNLSKRKNI